MNIIGGLLILNLILLVCLIFFSYKEKEIVLDTRRLTESQKITIAIEQLEKLSILYSAYPNDEGAKTISFIEDVILLLRTLRRTCD